MASSSDDEPSGAEDGLSAKIVWASYARRTLEVVVPAHMLKVPAGTPRELRLTMRDGARVKIMIPSDAERKFCVDLVPDGAGAWRQASADAQTPADGSECSRRTSGSSDNEVDAVGAHSPGSTHSSGILAPVDEVRACALQLCRWDEEGWSEDADHPDFQSARAALLESMIKAIAHDGDLGEASTGAAADVVLEYLDVLQQVRAADPEAADIILDALQSSAGQDRAPPLEAIRGQDVRVCKDHATLGGMRGNFVGFDMDSGTCRISLPASDGDRGTRDLPPDQLRVCESTEEARTHALWLAVHKQDVKQAAVHLAAGADPSGILTLEDHSIVSILQLACLSEKPDAEVVLLLLAAGADPEAVSPSGWSLSKALRARKNLRECLNHCFATDCDVLLAYCQEMGSSEECPGSHIDGLDIASFLRNLREEDLLHAAVALCDAMTICQLLTFRDDDAYDLNAEIEINGRLVSPLSLAYYSPYADSDRCVLILLAARADPHMPLSKEFLADGSDSWTLARAARADKHLETLEILKQLPLRSRTIVQPEAAAEWIWHRISCVGVTTAVVASMLEYLTPCMYLDELVREVLATTAESPEDEEPFAELYWKLAEQLLCVSTRFNDDKTVELLLRQGTKVDSHDDSNRSAAPTHCQSLARFLTRPDRPAQVCTVVRRPPWQRAARAEAARRWR